jgi:hypothetical protein
MILGGSCLNQKTDFNYKNAQTMPKFNPEHPTVQYIIDIVFNCEEQLTTNQAREKIAERLNLVYRIGRLDKKKELDKIGHKSEQK